MSNEDVVSYSLKIREQLNNKNTYFLKIYLSRLLREYPDITKCPIDQTLLKDTVIFLHSDFQSMATNSSKMNGYAQ